MAAVNWLEGTLLGIVATTIAIIAVAGIGLMALFGRVSVRQSVATILGCFILFGASSIAAGIASVTQGETASGFEAPPVVRADVAPPSRPPDRPANYDPYAGAAVPAR